MRVRKDDAVIAGRHGKALPAGKVHGPVGGGFTHRQALRGGQVTVPPHVPEIEARFVAGGEEGPAVRAEGE